MVLFSLLAVPAMFVAFFSGAVAFSSWRSGEKSMAAKAAGLCAVCVFIMVVAPKGKTTHVSTNCFIDWDGRANAEVCD